MTKDSNNIFGRRLNQARLIKGLTMDELGKEVQPAVTRQAINKYEKGLTMPDSRMLIAFSMALGVKPDYFFRPFTVAVDKIMFNKKTGVSERAVSSIREKSGRNWKDTSKSRNYAESELITPLKKEMWRMLTV